MLILFDNNVPRGLGRSLKGHTVIESRERGWAALKNGDLLTAGESAGFDLLITSDKNMSHQQNLTKRRIAIVLLSEQRWTMVQRRLREVASAVNAATPGTYTEVEIPYR